MKINSFIHQLSSEILPENCHNPYLSSTCNGRIRKENLRLYLQHMLELQPQMMLIGEAPGYRGCRLSGIPFVSPALLDEEEVTPGLFGKLRGFRTADEWPELRREASATIVWTYLRGVSRLPLLWNAFPFHPHHPNRPQSNRPPTRAELVWGRPFLHQLHNLFGRPQLIAVGKKAAHSLTIMDLPHHTVRHPSHGGKRAFIASLRALGL